MSDSVMIRFFKAIARFIRLWIVGPTTEIEGMISRYHSLSCQIDRVLTQLDRPKRRIVPVTVTVFAKTNETEDICMGNTVDFEYVENQVGASVYKSITIQPMVTITGGVFFITGPANIGVIDVKVGRVALIAAVNTHIRAGKIPEVGCSQRIIFTLGEYDPKA